MLLKNPCFTSTPDVKEICDEYFDRLGLNLNYFGTGRTFKDGQFDFLLSRNDWGVHHIIDNDNPPAGYVNYDEIENSIKLPHLEADPAMGWTENVIRQAKVQFDLQNLMVIFRKHDDHIQTFFFDLHNSNAAEIYINQFDIFEKFIFYFKDKARDLLKITAENRVMVSEQHRIAPQSKLRDQDNLLQPAQYFLRNNGKEYALTPREYECLTLAAHGKKIKMCAQLLNISPRTIDTHLENIKRKLAVSTLHEAIEIYWNNRII